MIDLTTMTRERALEIRALIEKAMTSLNDNDALNMVDFFPHWNSTKEYQVDDRVSYEDTLYKCLTAHTAQISWTPDVSPSLWVRVDNPAEEWPEWKQPLGSTDAYKFGAKVSHNGKHWISDYNANNWEPGVFGWSEVSN